MTALTFAVDPRAMDRELMKLRKRVAAINGRRLHQVEARALNRAAAWTTTRLRRELAEVKGVPQAVIKSRISSYKARPDHLTARVWVGTKRKIPIASLPGARSIIAGKAAGTLKAGRVSVRPFKVRLKNGRVMQVVRVEPGMRWTAGRPHTSPPNLPIEEPAIRLMPEAQAILETQALAAMRGPYINELRRLLARALKQ